jgi:hypothetical protein
MLSLLPLALPMQGGKRLEGRRSLWGHVPKQGLPVQTQTSHTTTRAAILAAASGTRAATLCCPQRPALAATSCRQGPSPERPGACWEARAREAEAALGRLQEAAQKERAAAAARAAAAREAWDEKRRGLERRVGIVGGARPAPRARACAPRAYLDQPLAGVASERWSGRAMVQACWD